MTRKRGAASTIVCPICGARYIHEPAAHGQRKRRKAQRYEFAARQPYQHSAAQVAQPAPQPWQHEPAPELPAMPTLAPGEEHTAKTYRRREASDLLAPLLETGLSGALSFAIAAGVAGIVRSLLVSPAGPTRAFVHTAQLWIGHRWWLFGSGTCLATMGWLWFKRQLPDLLDDDKLLTSVQEGSRAAEPAPVVVEPQPIEVIVPSANGRTQKRAKLRPPKRNPSGLWQYADALVRQTAYPSYEGGEHGLGAKAFGYTPSEFDGREDKWRPTAIAAGLLEEDPNKSKGYRLTDDGRRAFAQIAKHQLREYG